MISSFESMRESLSKLNLYDFSKANISNELKTYAWFFDMLKEELCTMLNECFVDTAQSYGLSEREAIIGAKRDGVSILERRNMLLLRESINKSSFTVSKIKESLKSFGLECEVYEYPSQYTVVLDSIGDYSKSQIAWIKTEVEKIMPAHLNVEIIINGATWSYSDSKDNTFSYIDSLDMTWNEIDNYIQ